MLEFSLSVSPAFFCTLWYDIRCSKADISQLSLPHRTETKKWKKEKLKCKNGYAQKYRSAVQESVESVLET